LPTGRGKLLGFLDDSDLIVVQMLNHRSFPAEAAVDLTDECARVLLAGEDIVSPAPADPKLINDLSDCGLPGHAPVFAYHGHDYNRKISDRPNALGSGFTYISEMERNVPHFLREWREHAKMTQDELAEAIGTSKSTISDMERGRLQLSPKWLRKIAPVLKTQPGYILDHDPADLDSDVIDIWGKIDASDRQQAARVLRSFIKRTGTSE
jgi:transcriptional regulator with XRE-family HTH domain